MSFQIFVDQPGYVGVTPRIIRVATTDSYAAVTAAGYLPNSPDMGVQIQPTDVILVSFSSNPPQFEFFSPSFSAGVITLVPNGGGVVLPTIANHIATYGNTKGELTEDPATAISGGNIQAGLSGTAGALVSFPSTASKGSLKLAATDNTGDTVTTITNAAFGQASTLTIPDPAGATAKIPLIPGAVVSGNLLKASGTAGLVADAGAKVICGTTGTYAGGGTSNAFTVTGLTSSYVGAAVIRTSTNAVSIAKALPGSNTLTITFSADPGAATTVDYVYFSAALT